MEMCPLRKNHKSELLVYLQNNPGWHTSNELAVVIGVSQRSIKRYAKDLIDSTAILGSEKGYTINQQQTNQMNKNESLNSDYGSIKRVLMNEFTQKEGLNIYDLSSELYLSESTVLKLIKEVKEYVLQFGLQLSQSGDIWRLNGSEMNKRKLISDILYRESRQTFIGKDSIKASFPDVDVQAISDSINGLAMESNIYLNTFDFNNILLHIAISTHRTKNGYQPISSDNKVLSDDVSGSTKQEKKFGTALITSVEKISHIQFSDEEKHSLILIIQFSITRKHRNLEDSITPNTAMLVDKLIKYVNTMLNIDLRVLNFREQFAIHIQRLLERSSHGYVERNPMTARIRKSSPIIYECAVLISNKLEETEDVDIEDDEIAYIAMHIGNAVSEYINDLHKLYAVILIPDYQSDLENFTSQLGRLFSQDIVIGQVIHDPSELVEKKFPRSVDFVIQVNTETPIDTYRYTNITQFLTQSDYKKVGTLIKEIKHTRKKINFTNNLEKFFPKQNFIVSQEKLNRDDLFIQISSILEKENVVKVGFAQKLIAREKMSSTAFGSIAIPHSLEMIALRTEGFVVIAPNGIDWNSDNHNVKMMFLLAVNETNKQAYRNIFDDFSQITVEPKNIAILLKSKTHEQFINTLVSLL